MAAFAAAHDSAIRLTCLARYGAWTSLSIVLGVVSHLRFETQIRLLMTSAAMQKILGWWLGSPAVRILPLDRSHVSLPALLSGASIGGISLKDAALILPGLQFYLYPHIGPPRGRFSHLQMFRIGSMLFIPAYLTLPLLRVFASADKDGGFVVMTCESTRTKPSSYWPLTWTLQY